MLGIQAMSNGHVILPNYQVRYSLKDLEFFKNSMVKNVALVDDELQGKEYTSNQGGSGFGKFKVLPQPKTIAWKIDNDLDIYVGSHNGFENIGVDYTRQVMYLKDDFWIVKDNFKSDKPHTYKQIWQGHYSLEEGPNLIRSTFNDGSGSDIYQLVTIDSVFTSGTRGKGWAVTSKTNKTNFSFISVIFPFGKYDDRIDEETISPQLKGWTVNHSKWKFDGSNPISLTKGGKDIFFSVKKLEFNAVKMLFSGEADVFLKLENDTLTIQSLSDKEFQISFQGFLSTENAKLQPGDKIDLKLNN
jgi:hypothetical protein